MSCRINQRGVEVCLVLVGDAAGAETDAETLWPSTTGRETVSWIFGVLCCMLNGVERVRRVVADELVSSVDDHLRRVDSVHFQALTYSRLPVGVLVRREAVVPALVVPVVHVLAQHDDLGAGDGLVLSSFASSASAGGQLEHPSEVKSSTRTGVAVRLSGLRDAVYSAAKAKTPDRTRTMAKDRSGNMELTSGSLELLDTFRLHPD